MKVLLSEIPDFRRLMFSWSLISICVTVLFTLLLSSFWSPTILVFILSAIEKFRPSSGVKYLDSGWLSLSIFEVASSSSSSLSSMVAKLSSIHDPQESWKRSPAYPGFTGFWGSEGISFLSDFSVSGVFSSSSELIVLSLTLTSVSNKPKLSFLAFTLPSAWDPMCSSSFSLSLIGTILSSIQEPQDSSTGSPAYAELTVLVKVLLSEITDFRRLMFSWPLISICVTVLFTL